MSYVQEKYHLKSSSFFDFLSPLESGMLKKSLVRREYAKGEVLFREGSFSKGLYLVKKGKVKIFQTSHDGKHTIVYIYKKGDYFGYRPILADEPHPVSAVAMDQVVISFIPRDIFLKALSESPTLAQKLLTVLSKEFSVWIHKMTVFSQHGVRERVALALLILQEVYRKTDESRKPVQIAISRDDLAGFVGTAKETLVRMLRPFKDQGIIETKGTRIVIHKPELLHGIAGEL